MYKLLGDLREFPDPRRRLLQEQDIRTMDQGATQSQLLLHTTGQLPRPPMLERLYLTIDIPYQIVVLLDRRIEDRSEKFKFSSTVRSW